jgi:hypothetical protein
MYPEVCLNDAESQPGLAGSGLLGIRPKHRTFPTVYSASRHCDLTIVNMNIISCFNGHIGGCGLRKVASSGAG